MQQKIVQEGQLVAKCHQLDFERKIAVLIVAREYCAFWGAAVWFP